MRFTLIVLTLVSLVAGNLSAQDSRPAILERLFLERRDVEERHRIAAETLAAEEDRLTVSLAAMKARKSEGELRFTALQKESARQVTVVVQTEARRAAANAAREDLSRRLDAMAQLLRARLSSASPTVAESIGREQARLGDTALPLPRRMATLSALIDRLLLDARTISARHEARDGKAGLSLRLGSLGAWWIPESGVAVRADGKSMSAISSDALRRVARQAARMESPAVILVPIEAFK